MASLHPPTTTIIITPTSSSPCAIPHPSGRAPGCLTANPQTMFS